MRLRGVARFVRSLLFWTLFPLVVPQAIMLRRHAPRLAGAAGSTSGSFGTGENIRLLAIGDSIIAGVGALTLADALPGRVAAELARMTDREVSWIASGLSGATSATVEQHLVPALPPETFDVIVISVGVNDVKSLKGTRQWSRDLGKLLDDLRAHSPESEIAFLGLPPLSEFPLLPQPLRFVMGIRARIFDDAARNEVSKRMKAVHVPIRFEPGPGRFSSDGFHPSPATYQELGREVAVALSTSLKSDSHTTSRACP